MSNDSVAQDMLIAFVRRIEALEDEGKAINDDKSEVYKEARGNGFDVKVLRKVIADRRKDASERNEFDAVYQLYWDAIHGVVRAHVENIEEFDADGVVIESTAARKDVPGQGQHEMGPSLEGSLRGQAGAGTQAPPVDTIIEPEAAMLPQTGAVVALVDPTAGELVTPSAEAADHGNVATDGAAAPQATNPGGDDVANPPAHAPEQPGTDHGSVNTPEGGGAQPSNITPLHRLNPKTHFANSKGLPRLHGCMNPEACGGTHRALCHSCARASEGSAA